MNNILKSVAVALCLTVFCLGGSCAQAGEGGPPALTKAKAVVVYYFYGTGRCSTCHKLEGYAKEALDTYFKKELAAGQIAFNPVNVDQPANEHYVQDYQLYSKSVVLSMVEGGKEVKHKNLTKIWQLVGNKEKYLEYIKGEVETFLKE